MPAPKGGSRPSHQSLEQAIFNRVDRDTTGHPEPLAYGKIRILSAPGFSHANYLAEFSTHAQSKAYEKSTLDLAMRDAFIKTRRFLTTTKGLTEDEAISLISVAVDFGVTQVVDGNWGVHAIIRKALFAA
jgi:acetamidase/formamidase